MKRLTALLLLAAFTQPSTAADLHSPAIPTSPQVAVPSIDSKGDVVPASALSRVIPAIRNRSGASPECGASYAGMPMPTGFNLTSYGCNGSNTGCAAATASHAGRYDRFKAWLCYRPTTGDALPKLNPHPYVGPIAGTFPCGPSGVGGGCGDGPGYAAASGGCAVADSGRGRVGPLMPGRGCQGQCVPPSDDAFPGYRFANPLSQTQGQPSNTPPLTQPIGYTTYKQIVGQGAKPAARP